MLLPVLIFHESKHWTSPGSVWVVVLMVGSSVGPMIGGVVGERDKNDSTFEIPCGRNICDMRQEYCEGDEVFRRCALCEDICIESLIQHNEVERTFCEMECPVYIRLREEGRRTKATTTNPMSVEDSSKRPNNCPCSKGFPDYVQHSGWVPMTNLVFNVMLLLGVVLTTGMVFSMSLDMKRIRGYVYLRGDNKLDTWSVDHRKSPRRQSLDDTEAANTTWNISPGNKL